MLKYFLTNLPCLCRYSVPQQVPSLSTSGFPAPASYFAEPFDKNIESNDAITQQNSRPDSSD